MTSIDRATIKHLMDRNWRGYSNLDLVSALQEARDMFLSMPVPATTKELSGIPYEFRDQQREYLELDRYAWACGIGSIIREVRRRRRLGYSLRCEPDREIISALKDKIQVADIIEWYTEVIYHKRVWQFRCPLHSDEHPSGVIYPKEQRWHCFQCGKHGDIFDAVCLFGHTDLRQAISILARHIGLDTKPIIVNKNEPYRGLVA